MEGHCLEPSSWQDNANTERYVLSSGPSSADGGGETSEAACQGPQVPKAEAQAQPRLSRMKAIQLRDHLGRDVTVPACVDLLHFDLMLRDMRSLASTLGPTLAEGMRVFRSTRALNRFNQTINAYQRCACVREREGEGGGARLGCVCVREREGGGERPWPAGIFWGKRRF